MTPLSPEAFNTTVLAASSMAISDFDSCVNLPVGNQQHEINVGYALFNLDEAYGEYLEAFYAWASPGEGDIGGYDPDFVDEIALPMFLRRQAL